eukprot:5391418-Amphidinium_carterae.1
MDEAHCCVRVRKEDASRFYHGALSQGLAIHRMTKGEGTRVAWLKSTSHADALVEAKGVLHEYGQDCLFGKLDKGRLTFGVAVP